MFQKTVWKRVLGFVLCAAFLIGSLAVGAQPTFADEQEEAEVIDYILLLDCTSNTAKEDVDGIRKAAAKMFVDLLPVDNARIAVFVTGFADEVANQWNGPENETKEGVNSYLLRADDGHIDYQSVYRMRCTYQIWDLDQPIRTEEQRAELKAKIDEKYTSLQTNQVIRRNGQELIHAADQHCLAYAAIDTLKYYNSQNACVLLVSGGAVANYMGHLTKDLNNPGKSKEADHTLWDDISATLAKHKTKWVFNWVALGTGYESFQNTIGGVCTESGGEASYASSISQLPEQITSIVSKYTGSDDNGHDEKLDRNGNATIELDSFVMMTEVNVVVTGDGVKKVSITDEQGVQVDKKKDDIWFSTNYDPQDRSHYLYSAIKLIRPAGGKWAVNIQGDPDSHVYVQEIRTLEPDIAFDCDYRYKLGDDGMIGVGTSLRFTATFEYAGERIRCGDAAYEHFLNTNCVHLEYTLSSRPNEAPVDLYRDIRVENGQYVLDFTVTEKGTYTFSFYVESREFKTNIRRGNQVWSITVANHAPAIELDAKIDDISDVPVGTHMEALFSINKLFRDIDNDPLTLDLKYKGENGREIDMEYEVAPDGYVSFNAPTVDGVYAFTARVRDAYEAESDPIFFKIFVVNEKPVLQLDYMKQHLGMKIEREKKKVGDQKVEIQLTRVGLIANASDALAAIGLLPKDACKPYTARLSEFFKDPEGLPLLFEVDATESVNKDGEKIVTVNLDHNSGELTVSADRKGKATIVVYAIDSAGAKEQYTLVFNVRTAGNVIGERFWWIPVLIALIAAAVAVLMMSRRVHGSWDVTVDDLENKSGCSHSFVSLPSANDPQLKKTTVSLLAIVKCAVRKEGYVGDVQTNPLKEKAVVFQGALSLGKGVAFIYTPVKGVKISIEDTVLTKSGKYILKKNQILTAECTDSDDASVLNVQASFH